MAQMPDIKPEVNKEPEKKPGILSGLFGGGGAGGSGAAGFGGLGGGSAAGGGLLATKTGLLALVLVGTTVAGGIGVVGYRVFGPGDSDQPSQNIQLFTAKPKEAAPDPNATAAAKDGSSASLEGFAKVNSGAMKGEAPAAAEAAPKDATPAGASAASAAAGAMASNAVPGSTGNGASKSMLNNTKKLGALSTSFGGGAGSAPSAGSSFKAGDAASLGAAGKGGQLGGPINVMGRGVGAASGARGVGARSRKSGAQNQARFARDMGRQNQSSMAGAGRGFDNSAAGNGGTDIGGANTIGTGGAGTGTGTQPKSIANPTNANTKDVTDPVAPTTYDVTPYSKEMGIAKMLVLLAAGLLYYASTLAKERAALASAEASALAAWEAASETGVGAAAAEQAWDTAHAAVISNENMIHYLCYAAGLAGAAIIYYGVKIAGGDYGQKSQGMLLDVVGGAVIVGAKLAYAGVPSSAVTLIAAGAGLAGMMSSMLITPKTCKSTEEGNADKCTSTSMIQKTPGSPSEKALEEYLT